MTVRAVSGWRAEPGVQLVRSGSRSSATRTRSPPHPGDFGQAECAGIPYSKEITFDANSLDPDVDEGVTFAKVDSVV